MRFFDKTFFKFLLVFVLILAISLAVINYASAALVNINTASQTELETLNGIGPSKAQAIIDYRNTNSSFKKIEDIKNVSGIGDVTYNNIKDYITVGDSSAATVGGTGGGFTTVNYSLQPTISTHYSSSPATSSTSELNISVSAGRERLSSVKSPIEFKAETNLLDSRENSFRWNFGDGGLSYGKLVTHAYEYPGEYVVVLNASTPKGNFVSRTKVTIIEPEVSIVYADSEKVQLKNDSTYEINLYGKALVAGEETYIFPPDTILSAKQTLFLSSAVTGLKSGNMAVINTGEKDKEISRIQNELSRLENQLASMQKPDATASVAQQRGVVQGVTIVAATTTATETQVAAAAKSGWFATLKKFFLRK